MNQKISPNSPLVSIVVPTYNRLELLQRLISSLLNQTYNNLEIIIINNGSTDETAGYLDYIQKVHSNIIIDGFKKNTGSPMACYNKGIDLASGKYIGFIYDDDTLLDDGISFLISKIIENNIDWAVGNCIDNRTGSFTFHGPNNNCDITFNDIILEKFTGEAWAILDIDLFRDIRFDPKMYGGESSVWLQIYKKTSAKYFHKAVRVYYTQHGGNITGVKGIINNIEKIFYTEEKYIELFGEDFKSRNILKTKYYRLSLILLLAGRRLSSYKYIPRYFEIANLHRILIQILLSLLPRPVLLKLVEIRAKIRGGG